MPKKGETQLVQNTRVAETGAMGDAGTSLELLPDF